MARAGRGNAKSSSDIKKSSTGVSGLDEITGGGLPRGRATLIAGGPGSGKSVLALQSLVHGATVHGEPGIFVAFEESASRIVENAESFGWDLPALQRKKLFFLDAQPSPDLLHAGSADTQGLLAALDARVKQMGAKRIVFDSLDILLAWLGNETSVSREVARIHDWLLASKLTVLVTARVHGAETLPAGALEIVPFMVDCVVSLRHAEVESVSQRSLRVLKYRGSGFAENASPMIIGDAGVEVAGPLVSDLAPTASAERVSSGVPDLDAMLSGGYHRASSVLVTGSPGTAKTTLAGAFLQAAGERGERALMISFDSGRAELVRNLASVGVRLARFLKSGLLRIEARSAGNASAEAHFLYVRRLLDEHRPRVLVVDPVSALGKQGNEGTAHNVVERLIGLAKSRDITVFCTSLLNESAPGLEGSRLNVSTIADSWLHLSYIVNAGERNRALTIVKSRGTAHSNQVRELVLKSSGISLTDVYAAEGEVLMGSLRRQREQHDEATAERRATSRQRRDLRAKQVREDLSARIDALQRELQLRESELALATKTDHGSETRRAASRAERVNRRRGERAP